MHGSLAAAEIFLRPTFDRDSNLLQNFTPPKSLSIKAIITNKFYRVTTSSIVLMEQNDREKEQNKARLGIVKIFFFLFFFITLNSWENNEGILNNDSKFLFESITIIRSQKILNNCLEVVWILT